MTDYEIIMILFGVISLLISSSLFLVSLLGFLDKRNNRKK